MKLVIMVAVVLFLIGGGLAAAMMGLVNVPGISPTNFGKRVEASPDGTGGLLFALTDPLNRLGKEADDAQKKAEKAAPPPKDQPVPNLHPEEGDLKLATYWNGLQAEQLVKITEKWQPAAVAKVLMKMDEDQVSKYLNQLKPDRADQISRAIQALASQPPATPGS